MQTAICARSCKDAAVGCLLGAAVGDAAGATLEFIGVTPELVDKAMGMPGGGCWRVGPGQFTDDTELALSLARGLWGHNPQNGFPTQSVAQQYHDWLRSGPFDVGATCAAAFGAGPNAASMQAAAVQRSSGSKANGALMRATPIAIWAHRLSDEAIAAYAAADAVLSHPNRACQDANAAYCIAAAHLIRCPGDSRGAVAAAEAWAGRSGTDPEVKQWLLRDSTALDISTVVDATEAIGFVKHGFTMAFHHLRRCSSFLEAMRFVLLAGGDTDTNAAIVGGLLGALWGAEDGITAAMARPVLEYKYPADGKWPGHDRPPELQGNRILEVAEELFLAGP